MDRRADRKARNQRKRNKKAKNLAKHGDMRITQQRQRIIAGRTPGNPGLHQFPPGLLALPD